MCNESYIYYKANKELFKNEIETNQKSVFCNVEILKNNMNFDVKYLKEEHEFEINFEDEKYVFSKNEKKDIEYFNIDEDELLGSKEMLPFYLKILMSNYKKDNLKTKRYNPFEEKKSEIKITKIKDTKIKEYGKSEIYFVNFGKFGFNILYNRDVGIIYGIDPFSEEEFVKTGYKKSNIKKELLKSVEFEASKSVTQRCLNESYFLTMPKKEDKKYPAVILLSGSGNLDHNGNVGDLRFDTLKQLANNLSSMGIATIRYNDKKKGGSWLEDSVEEFCEAIEILKKEVSIDKSSIYVLGHSQGGIIGIEALNRYDILKGLILMGVPGKEYEEFFIEQMKTFHKKSDEVELNAFLDYLKGEAVENISNNKYFIKHKFELNRLKELINMNLKEKHQNIVKPTLILHGEKDFQVDLSHSKRAFENISSERKEVKVFENLNHYFVETEMNTLGDYSKYGQEIPSNIMSEIQKFIEGC